VEHQAMTAATIVIIQMFTNIPSTLQHYARKSNFHETETAFNSVAKTAQIQLQLAVSHNNHTDTHKT
jgi:hypothetical protein